MKLDVAGAERALNDKIAKPLGLTLTEAAEGILRISNTLSRAATKK